MESRSRLPGNQLPTRGGGRGGLPGAGPGKCGARTRAASEGHLPQERGEGAGLPGSAAPPRRLCPDRRGQSPQLQALRVVLFHLC